MLEADDGSELRLALQGRADAVGEARKAVASFTAERVPSSRAYELLLAVSEIVTNAVLHGPADAPIQLLARTSDDHLRVDVTDSGEGFVSRPGALDSDREGGYGLFLVERLARRWGVVRQRSTTRVWFEFDL